MNEESIRVKLRRRCRGTTQAQVARDIGISPQLLCDVLRGRRAPGPAILRALGLEGRRIYRVADER